MDFYPYEPFDSNQAQRRVWEWLREALKDDGGVAYYRYPIFTRTGKLNREPDILLLHREWGVWVIECKGCSIGNIRGIQGHEWQMKEWYSETMTPVAQAEDQMFALRNKLEERRESRGLISSYNFRVALPQINRQDWVSSGWSELPSTTGVVWVYEDLTPAALRKHLSESDSNRQRTLNDKEWELVKGVLGGTLPSRPPRDIPAETPVDNPVRVIHHIESELKILDETQQQIAFGVPEGAQRLRGLAGTGKTVLLAKRAAKMHVKHPEWTIAFVFFTRSLYDQILELIALYHREMHPDHIDPDWTRLKVLHAWGAKDQDGFYRTLALRSGQRPLSLNDVKQAIGNVSPGESFEYICERLVNDVSDIPVLYDAILIDEGQDLPPVFYRLAYQTLSDPRRLYWAYDEAQGIGSLIVPDSETIFGRTEKGELLVDLSGNYEGGIQKSHKMNKCYRTPRLLLMTAHAINMGLFRQGGALQGVTTKKDWQDLGYEIVAGDFSNVSVSSGKTVTITRPDERSPHPIDRQDFPLQDVLGSPLVLRTFDAEEDEQKWIARQVKNDLERGFDSWDLVITAVSGDYEKDYLSAMQLALEREGVDCYIAGVDGNPSIFRRDGCVTIGNIFRAKGNEAWKVYASRFHYATMPLAWKREDELHKRNEAFVALTRAKVWCVATGLENPIFDELQTAIEQYPKLTFPAFNKNSLRRSVEESES